ncbi:MAG: ABC transporter ATP-binding protein [Nitrospirae bacterium]|nr:ABC transporter ATP-binding protein [Nitrospirota bacterium]
MLQVDHLGKRFGGITALDDVSFSVGEGEIIGLLGENGAGKTTTLRLLAGELMPSRGRVTVGGRDLFSDVIATRRKVGYLPEQLPLDRAMRVRPFLDYVARLRGLNAGERLQGVARVIDACGLSALAERGIGNLSRGGRMRVGLAQALVHNPEVLLLDEPTAGLDPQQVLNMRALILSLSGHHTIVFSSHNLTEVAAVCNRILFLKGGRLVAEDVLTTVTDGGGELLLLRFSNPPADLCARVLAFPAVAAAEPVPGGGAGAVSVQLKAGAGLREQLAERAAMMGWGLCELRPMAGNLTAIFQHHAAATGAPPAPPDAALEPEEGMDDPLRAERDIEPLDDPPAEVEPSPVAAAAAEPAAAAHPDAGDVVAAVEPVDGTHADDADGVRDGIAPEGAGLTAGAADAADVEDHVEDHAAALARLLDGAVSGAIDAAIDAAMVDDGRVGADRGPRADDGPGTVAAREGDAS